MSSFDERILSKFTNVIRTRGDLHGYQADIAMPFLRDNPFSALFIDMGLGKTITSLTLLTDLLSEFAYEHVLIIGPLRVASETWPTEIGLWDHTAPLNHSLIHVRDDDPRVAAVGAAAREKARADARDFDMAPSEYGQFVAHVAQKAETAEKERLRREAATSRATIHIISRDWVEWLVEFHGPKWPYRCVIVDESSGFKDHKSGRFKALSKVRNSAKLIKRMHLLTATPAAETYENLFAQIYLLDRGKRFGKGITKFRERYFTYNKYSRKYKLRPGAEEEILAKIADICLVMKVEDYLDIREPVFAHRSVKLDEAQMALYRTMEKEFIVTLPNGCEVEAETAAALSQKLLQMASGTLYETYLDGDIDTDDMRKVKRVHKLHDHKIEELREIVAESQGEPLLVSYHFKSSLDRLKKAFPKAVAMDREGKCVKTWNSGKIPMLLIHPQSGGHGLNMQHGGHNLVFFDLPWSLELYLQLIGRLARQGQKNVVVVQMLIAAGTLDEVVYQALNEKSDAQEKLFRILKRLIKKARAKKEQPVDFFTL